MTQNTPYRLYFCIFSVIHLENVIADMYFCIFTVIHLENVIADMQNIVTNYINNGLMKQILRDSLHKILKENSTQKQSSQRQTINH